MSKLDILKKLAGKIEDLSLQGKPVNLMEEGPLKTVSKVGETLDTVAAKPVRRKVLELLSGKTPVEGQDTGENVANAFLKKLEEQGMPLRTPGQEEFPLQKPLGLVADLGLDVTNLTPVGLAKLSALKKLSKPVREAEEFIKGRQLLNDQEMLTKFADMPIRQFKPMELQKMSPEAITRQQIEKSNYTTMTAANPMGQQLGGKVNKERMMLLRNKLDQRDIQYKEGIGAYGSQEPTLLIPDQPGLTTKQLEDIAKEFGQEAIFTKKGNVNELRFVGGKQAGQEQVGSGIKINPEAEDMYTKLGNIKFQGDIGSNLVPSKLPDLTNMDLDSLKTLGQIYEKAGFQYYSEPMRKIQSAINRLIK